MVIVTESRILAFALSLSQEYQNKPILLNTVIEQLGIFLLSSPFENNVPDHPLVSISNDGL